MKILVIEDEIKIADFVVSGLQQAGFETNHATDGASGLDAILHGHYDLVVLDVMLPKMNGLDVLQQVRQQGYRTPIISAPLVTVPYACSQPFHHCAGKAPK